MDLVNSRDYSYAKGYLDSDSKLSNFMVNYELNSDLARVQFLYIPQARKLLIPTELGDATVSIRTTNEGIQRP